MGLALLDIVDHEKGTLKCSIDIGENNYYRIVFGNETRDYNGFELIDNAINKTALLTKKNNPAFLFKTSEEIVIPTNTKNKNAKYIQLFTYKTKDLKSPTFSQVKRMTPEINLEFSTPYSLSPTEEPATQIKYNNMPENIIFQPVRKVNFSAAKMAYQSSFDDILGGILRIATPIVQQLLNNPAGVPAGGSATGSTGSQPDLMGSVGNLVVSLLGRIVAGTAPNMAAPHSLANSFSNENRFQNTHSKNGSDYSKPFIFGIDDAIIGALAGPIIQQGMQMLPQLMNAANANRLAQRQESHRFTENLVSDVNKNLLMQQLLQNQSANAAHGTIDPNQLLLLLQQLPQAQAAPNPAGTLAAGANTPAPAATAPAVTAPAVAHSLSLNYAATLSSTVFLTLNNPDKLDYDGNKMHVYTKSSEIKFPIALNFPGKAPSTNLPKAIFKLIIKNKDKIEFEKVYKRVNINPAENIFLELSDTEQNKLSTDTRLDLFVEMRWLSPKNKEYKCLGSDQFVFAKDMVVKSLTRSNEPVKEPKDMNAYRAFWNKIWDSRTEGDKTFWELDVSLKYHVLQAKGKNSNGILESKMLLQNPESETITQYFNGKMKSGIQLSISEVNKLLPLWSGKTPLNANLLAALDNSKCVSDAFHLEAVTSLKLKGKKIQKGIIWALPCFALADITIGKIKETNANGVVTSIAEEVISFPIPQSIRILGLKTRQE
ncbi:MAG: hypothetical protein KG003_02125 [Bacteroidetes bacterium]|nr:hypothetical protein [Bacteroidota bacterium]